MKKRLIKYAAFSIVFLIVGFNSVYFKKLSDVKASSENEFDAVAFTKDFWEHELIPGLDQGVEMTTLLTLLKSEPDKAFQNYSHALGIGNIKYFQVKGDGEVTHIDDNYVVLSSDTTKNSIYLVTEFVYGNAVRDASGKININDFTNTMNLNMISSEINRKIREEVIPPFKASVKVGDKVHFTGALELNQKYVDLDHIEINPTSLTILP